MCVGRRAGVRVVVGDGRCWWRCWWLVLVLCGGWLVLVACIEPTDV